MVENYYFYFKERYLEKERYNGRYSEILKVGEIKKECVCICIYMRNDKIVGR